ncbi:uncharacterized protein B0H64DRAFT_393379 [Chaetomium fimeti]|uniref:Uncharacterized protein n=1 Tax=Chaetomium fimeti TaxID=1854472 RepID=A0AAE0HKJ4_9PEZI|nr:hypothetical protein B0H64DRAFT_393379 [Chaetomium fimeti]
MDHPKSNDVPAGPPVPPTASRGCTPLERRLASWCFFLSILVLNALLRIFIWPHVSGSPYLIFVVVGTRMVVGLSWLRLYEFLTGEKHPDPLLLTAMGFLPTILVDLGLGSCYRSCSVRDVVARGYCKYG